MAQGAGYSFNSDTITASGKVRDLAGYFMHGTIVGSAALSSGGGKYGDGLHCTGGAMQLANINQFFYPVNTDGGMSIAAWVKLDTTTAAARCIASAKSSALNWALYASNASGNVEVNIAGTAYPTTTSIRDGAWHHVMLVHDKVPATKTLNVYVDGVNVLSTTTPTPISYSGNVTFEAGRNVSTGLEPLNGMIDDLRWWNDPVESTYISTVVGAEQVDFQYAIYPFDDDTANDASIYGRNLTKATSATFGVGLYGRTIIGSGTEAAASGVVNFGDVDRLSVTGWMRLDVAPSGTAKPVMAITDTGGTAKMSMVVNLDRTITSTWVTVHGTYSVTSGSALTVGQWSRFHLNMNPTYIGIRLNSVTQAQTASSNPVPHLSPTVTDLKTLYVAGNATGAGQVSFNYLAFTRNFLDSVADLYWSGPPTFAAAKPVNLARGVYTMNEGSGTTANDRSGNGNSLTLTSGGSWMTAVQGTALHSAGTSPNGVAARKASGLAWSATPLGWAYAGWVKCRASSSGARFMTMRNSSGEVAHTGVLSGLFWVRLYGSGGTTGIINPTPAAITAETWTHVAISCNGDQIEFFLNGEWVASAAYTVGTMLSPTELNLGGDTADDAVADTDDFALYDTPISLSNVLWLYQNPGMLTAGTPVANSRATSWNTKATAAQTRSTSWNTKARVAQSRATSWNASGALVAVTRAISTTWNIASSLISVATQKATSWRTLATSTASTSTTWNTNSDIVVPDGPTKRVVFPTYKIPLGRNRLLRRYLVDVPSSLVRVNGEWVVVTSPAQDLLEAAEHYFIGGYTYQLTEAEVADLGLPPQYVEPIP